MKKIKINNKDYEVIEDYKDGLNVEELTEGMTEFFDIYDYILGDWAYGKLRLKGFCSEKNKNKKELNDYKIIKDYIKKYCAYECRYFIIKKI